MSAVMKSRSVCGNCCGNISLSNVNSNFQIASTINSTNENSKINDKVVLALSKKLHELHEQVEYITEVIEIDVNLV